MQNNPKQPFHERNFFENKIFSNRIIKKPEKGYLCFFFGIQFLLMD